MQSSWGSAEHTLGFFANSNDFAPAREALGRYDGRSIQHKALSVHRNTRVAGAQIDCNISRA
jgi:hypothetical protein